MHALLLILTVYVNHSASTTTVPMPSVGACRQVAANLRKQIATISPPPGAEVHVIARCVEAP